MRCLIVDDEVLARREMEVLLSSQPGVEVVGQAGDVQSALELTATERPDVVFLDVRLRGETGFDYVAQCGEDGPRVVFVTAYDKFAVRAFECNALDYLLKPVKAERLAQSLQRVQSGEVSRMKESDSVFLKGASMGRFVPWKMISHIVAEGNYSRVVLTDGAELVVHRPLKDWLGLAPEGRFLQIHRSAIVRLDAMGGLRTTATGQREVVMKSGAAVAIGRAYWGALRDFL